MNTLVSIIHSRCHIFNFQGFISWIFFEFITNSVYHFLCFYYFLSFFISSYFIYSCFDRSIDISLSKCSTDSFEGVYSWLFICICSVECWIFSCSQCSYICIGCDNLCISSLSRNSCEERFIISCCNS